MRVGGEEDFLEARWRVYGCMLRFFGEDFYIALEFFLPFFVVV